LIGFSVGNQSSKFELSSGVSWCGSGRLNCDLPGVISPNGCANIGAVEKDWSIGTGCIVHLRYRFRETELLMGISLPFVGTPRYFVKIGPGVIFAEEDYFELTKDRRIDGTQTFAIGTQAYRVEYFCTYSEGDYCLRSVDMDLTLRPVITWIGPTRIPQGSTIAYSTPVEEH
jgi:hypothetical protein